MAADKSKRGECYERLDKQDKSFNLDALYNNYK